MYNILYKFDFFLKIIPYILKKKKIKIILRENDNTDYI